MGIVQEVVGTIAVGDRGTLDVGTVVEKPIASSVTNQEDRFADRRDQVRGIELLEVKRRRDNWLSSVSAAAAMANRVTVGLIDNV